MGAIEATDTEYQNSWAFETKQIHAGWDRDPQTGATSIPILQTTSFAFDSAERAAARFAWATRPMITSRPESLPSKAASARS